MRTRRQGGLGPYLKATWIHAAVKTQRESAVFSSYSREEEKRACVVVAFLRHVSQVCPQGVTFLWHWKVRKNGIIGLGAGRVFVMHGVRVRLDETIHMS